MAANRTRSTWTITNSTITAGGTSQQVAAFNSGRQFFFFQNTSDTAMWLNFGANAATNVGIQVAPGATYTFPVDFTTTRAINVICTTTGKTFAWFQV